MAIGGNVKTKDVSWGDFFLALLLTPLLVLPVVAAVYVVLFMILEVSSETASDWWYYTTWLVTCAVEGFVFAALYERRGHRVEYRWAWVLIALAIAASIVALFLAGIISSEVSLVLAVTGYGSLAAYFLLIMLTLVLSTRSKAPYSSERTKASGRRDPPIAFLRR